MQEYGETENQFQALLTCLTIAPDIFFWNEEGVF